MEASILKNINISLTADHVILSPAHKKHSYCLIFLHGIQMSVQKFFSVFLSSSIIGLLKDFKIYIPQAPIRPIAMYGGVPGFSWYSRDQETMNEATEKLIPLIEEEVKLLDGDAQKVFIGGFSQGSAVAMSIASAFKFKFGGIVIIGGFLAEFTKFAEERSLPDVLIIHGDKDAIIPLEKCKESFKDILTRPNVKFIIMEDMKHDLYSEEAKTVIYDFLRARAKEVKD